MDDFSNSLCKHDKPAEPTPERKKVTPITKGKKNKGFGQLAKIFIAEDIASVRNYIVDDVLIPAVKKAIDDIVSEGTHMLLYNGESSRRSRGASSYISYGSYYDSDRRDSPRREGVTRRTFFDYDSVTIPHRDEAEDVILRLDESIRAYKYATVAEFYELVGITADYTLNKYGWTDLRTAKIVPVRGGFQIKFPKAMPIE